MIVVTKERINVEQIQFSWECPKCKATVYATKSPIRCMPVDDWTQARARQPDRDFYCATCREGLIESNKKRKLEIAQEKLAHWMGAEIVGMVVRPTDFHYGTTLDERNVRPYLESITFDTLGGKRIKLFVGYNWGEEEATFEWKETWADGD